MKEVVIVNPMRTPIGSFGGALRTVPAYDLAKIMIDCVIQATRHRSGRAE